MNKINGNPGGRMLRLLTLIALAALAWAAWIVDAEEEKKALHKIPFYTVVKPAGGDGSPWSGWIIVGVGAVSEEGASGASGLSAGRAAEYRSARNSPLFGTKLFYDGGTTYWTIRGLYADPEEVSFALNGSASRILISDTTIERYIHRLDNDPASDWAGSSVYTLDPGSAGVETEIAVTDLRSRNRLKIPALKGAVIVAHLRMLARDGDRQARTLDHCTTCHVSTAGQGLSQRTTELAVGGELAYAPVGLSYRHVYRKLDDSSEAMSHDYVNYFGNFGLEGVRPYAMVPDNKRSSDLGAARFDLGAYASAMVKARRSSTTNETTGFSIDSDRFSGTLTLRPAPWVIIRGRYDRIEWTNEVPLSSQRKVQRSQGTVVFRPIRQIRLQGSYRREEINRSGGTELEQTITKAYRFKGILRPDRTLRLMVAYRSAEVSSPFGRILRNSFSRIEGVLLSPLGTDENEFEAMLTYSPAPGRTLTAGYRRNAWRNSSVNLDARTQSLTVGGHLTVTNGLVLFGRFFRYDNDVERDVYLGVLAPLLEIRKVPYDGCGTSAEVGATLPLAEAVVLKCSYIYTRAESSFDDSALGTGVSAASAVDATVNGLSLEGDVSLTRRLGLLLAYYLDDYSDANLPLSDGTVHWFYGGLRYEF